VWHSGFDPQTKPFVIQHIWVLLPGLPLELWSGPILESIANSLGKFISFDEKILQQEDKRVVKVLVELDISKGILLELDMVWKLGYFLPDPRLLEGVISDVLVVKR
jgi:hypothetical protein